ncbi:hypothetical protein HYH03_003047 [Edaphochlamys debaryana]|uniref:PUM-HD domain-containing protein n=1 Tax=Edaphochlamys debaryana TaxID=47281 RepID=A0A835Y9L0_9CHLO|nr:hypothetical protein HYH03_003047 [Edaphochlamys debaryana]|eukprot:KAG2498855.1 hypothetical protein HYH03_003047 [Edaphochlamys debaryana]
MAKPGKPAPAGKPGKPTGKPSPGGKRKAERALPAAAPAKKPKVRAEGGKPGGADALKKLSSKDKREKIREKKLAFKKNWNIIQDSVLLWEKLRPRETPDEDRRELVSDILKKVKGKLLELSNHHTASRIIQHCIKHGGEAERKVVMEEVKANIVELSRSKYGHFLVRKLINTAKKDDVPALVRLFRGQVANLLRQPYGADVITDLYDVASTADRNALCAEFYGKEFVLFGGLTGEASRLHSLKQLMAGVPPAKQRAVLLHMTKCLQPIMEKALVHPPMTHRLLKDYLECAPGLAVEDAVETLSATGEAVLRMVHTHEGAAAACMVLGYGTPKDRKKLVRAMKGHVPAMAADEWGHAVLCMALSCVDDTALTGKVLVPEIKELMGQGVHQTTFVRVLLSLLAPGSRRHFPPAIHELLHPPQRTVRGSSGKSVTELDEQEEDAMDFHAAAGAGDEGDDGDDLFAAPKGKGGKKGKQQGGKGGAADKAKPKAKGRKPAPEEDEEEKADAEAGKGDGGEEGEERVLGASKKDPVVRRRELLGAGPKAMSAALTAAVAAEAGALLRSPHSCELVVEVARGGDDGLLQELQSAGVAEVQAALVEDAARSAEEVAEASGAAIDDEDGGAEAGPSSSRDPNGEHLMTSYYSSRALRRLLLAAADESPPGAAAAFAKAFWEGALKGRCGRWVGSHGEKVLAALLHCGVAEVVAAASKELKGLVKQPLEEWASKFLTHGHEGGRDKAAKKGKEAGPGPSAAGAKAQEVAKPEAKPEAQAGKKGKGGQAAKAPEPAPEAAPAGRPKRAAAVRAAEGAKAKQAKR